MNPAGAGAAITDTIPPALATQAAPDRATAGQAATTAAPGGAGQRQDDAGTRARRARLVVRPLGLLGLVSLIVSPWTGVVLILVAGTGVA